MEEHSKVCSLFFIVLCFNKSYYLYLAFNNNLKRIDVSTELVVDVQPKEVSIALLDDKRLVELQKEARNISFSVGDIYLGRVKMQKAKSMVTKQYPTNKRHTVR